MKKWERQDFEIQTVAAWVLRGGVITSVSVMILGLALTFRSGTPSVALMESRHFNGDLSALVRGVAGADPLSIMEAGVLLLVLTPILRVACSIVLFAFAERDWLYTAITTAVLAITLYSLLILR